MKHAWWLLLIGCGAASPHAQTPASASGPRVASVSLSVIDLAAAEHLFVGALGARVIGRGSVSGPDLERLEQTPSADRIELAIGGESIELVHYEGAPHPYREGARSNDLDFQHLALVTGDIDAALARLASAGVHPVSPEPQRIPDSNPAAGGIRAYYFRDAEGHPLELIWYPEGRGDPRWQRAQGDPLRGIDHTAIASSDTQASLRFYVDLLGMHVAGTSFNEGVEQERLSGVPGARVRITGLRGAAGPGIELLQYESPGPGRARDPDGAADATHWETTVVVEDLDAIAARLRGAGVTIDAEPGECGFCAEARAMIARDPDQHAIRVVGR